MSQLEISKDNPLLNPVQFELETISFQHCSHLSLSTIILHLSHKPILLRAFILLKIPMIFIFYFQTFHYLFLICTHTPANPSATFTATHWKVEQRLSIEIMDINAVCCPGSVSQESNIGLVLLLLLTLWPTLWDLPLPLKSPYLLDNAGGTNSVAFDGIHWFVDKGKGHVLEAGGG